MKNNTLKENYETLLNKQKLTDRVISQQKYLLEYQGEYSNFLSKQLEIERKYIPRYWIWFIILMITYWFGVYWVSGVVSFFIGIIFVIITWIACTYMAKQKMLAFEDNMDKFESKIKKFKK